VEPARASSSSKSERSAIRRLPSVEGVEVFRASFRRFSYARHSHESYAFGAIQEGVMRFWHSGSERTAYRGDIITLNPAEVHDGHADPDAGCRYKMLYVESAALDGVLAEAARPMARGLVLRGPVLRDVGLAARILAFTGEGASALEEQSHLAEILLDLFARHGVPPLALPRAGAERKCVARAKQCIHERVGEQLRLDELAAAAHLSNFHFLRTFKRETGMPPHAYLNQIRLKRARVMLRAGEAPAQVAAALGFVDQSHLTRRFKSAFGVTPAQYRAAQPGLLH
jgi:AraC-like DNA-binding protein